MTAAGGEPDGASQATDPSADSTAGDRGVEAAEAADAVELAPHDADADADADAEPGTEGAIDAAAELDGPLPELPTSAAAMDDQQLKHLVEALIFASDKPVTAQRLRQLTRVSDVRRLEQALASLATDYLDRGLVLQQVSGGYQFRTRTQFSVWVQQLIAGRPVRLSRAQLETLAIVAYRQPITRPEIDDIRGVDSSQTLKLLLDRALVRVLGKKEEVGRPILYGTTKEFLDFFSLGDLRELPTLREYSELTDESRRVISDRLGDATTEAESDVEREPDAGAHADDSNGHHVDPLGITDDDMLRAYLDADDAGEPAASNGHRDHGTRPDDDPQDNGDDDIELHPSLTDPRVIGFAAGSVDLDSLEAVPRQPSDVGDLAEVAATELGAAALESTEHADGERLPDDAASVDDGDDSSHRG